MRRARLPALVLALAAAAHAQTAGPAPATSTGESWELFRWLAEHPRVALTVPSGPCEAAAERLAETLLARGELEPEIDPEGEARGAARVVAGAAGDPALEALWRPLGLEPIAGGFHLLGRDFVERGDALVAVFRDPEGDGRPVCAILGNDVEELAAYLDALPRLSRPWLSVWADGEPALDCPLELDGRPRTDGLRDHLAWREAYFAGTEPVELPGVTIRARRSPDAGRVQAYQRALAAAATRVKQWLGAPELPTAELLVYEHLEDFERCLGTGALSLANRLRPRVHVLLASGMPDDAGAGLARVLAREAAGEPAAAWLADGLAVGAAGAHWGRPLGEWIAHLASGELLPPLAEVVAADAAARWSEHALVPARALLFTRALGAGGGDPRKTLALWKGAELEPARLEALYRRGALELVRAAGGARRGESGVRGRSDRVATAPFRHGLALVEVPEAPYGSRALDEAVVETRTLEPGPDACSLTVLACAEDPLAPPTGPAANLLASASDLALASSAAAARAADLRVLLSLEVLSSATGAWADIRSWTEPDELERFFAEYGRVALHYGLLAELLRVELLSFGSNLWSSIRTEHADARDPERIETLRAGWTELVRELRKAFGGGITCSSRLPEAHDVGIFDEVDFIGLLVWPRLARVGTPDDSELRRALRYELQQGLDLAIRWNRPLVLVQVGYPARSASWSRPDVPRGAYDPLAQVRFHEALADVLEGGLENHRALRGFYLWSWSAGADDPAGGFSLRGSPALSAVERLFGR